MSEILDNIYIWVFLVNTESVLRLALVRTVFCCTFWRVKILILWPKIIENLLIFVHLSCPKNSSINFTKAFISQEWLVVESCPTLRWIVFLMLYRLVYNIRSHFNELILPWSTYLEISQNSQESTSARATFLNKVAGLLKRGAGTGFFL